MKINKCLDNLWQFLRGDFKLSEFENGFIRAMN